MTNVPRLRDRAERAEARLAAIGVLLERADERASGGGEFVENGAVRTIEVRRYLEEDPGVLLGVIEAANAVAALHYTLGHAVLGQTDIREYNALANRLALKR